MFSKVKSFFIQMGLGILGILMTQILILKNQKEKVQEENIKLKDENKIKDEVLNRTKDDIDKSSNLRKEHNKIIEDLKSSNEYVEFENTNLKEIIDEKAKKHSKFKG